MKNDELEIIIQFSNWERMAHEHEMRCYNVEIYDGCCGLPPFKCVAPSVAAAIDNIYLHHNSKIPNQIY